METTEKRGPGRPRKYSKPLSQQLAIRATFNQRKRWAKTAKRSDQEIGDWARESLDAACSAKG